MRWMRWLKWISVILFAASLAVLVVCITAVQRANDKVPPVINMEQYVIDVSIQADEQDILEGVTAFDNRDGDITDSLMVEYLSDFIAEGEREVSIAAIDSSGNVDKQTRIIRYTDYQAPRFSLTSPLRFAAGTKAEQLTGPFRAEDCLDGDVTRWIQRYNAEGSSINMDVPGCYKVVYAVANSAGDSERFQATVEIYSTSEDSEIPRLTLDSYLIYLNVGETFDPMNYLRSVRVEDVVYEQDEDGLFVCRRDEEKAETDPDVSIRTFSKRKIKIDNPVNTDEPGWYEVTYSVIDSMDQEGSVRLLVRVLEEKR